MSKVNEYRLVVAIDFGTTYSGFAYAHKENPRDIYVHIDWQDFNGRFKTPTALSYDDEYKNVQEWGYPALAPKPKRATERKPIELFKLHLMKMSVKPHLPERFDYKKAIVDYLKEMGKVIKQTISEHWEDIKFFAQVLIVLTVPAEFDDDAIATMRECAYKAELLSSQYSPNLVITTEPEAAAIHCMKSLKEHKISVGETFTVVDCGGGTVDLTTRQLLEGNRLGEITVRTGDCCGGSFVDQEFLKFVESKVGSSAIELAKENHYGQLQYMVQEFCRMVKTKFTGVKSDFRPISLELDDLCPVLEQYCKGDYLDNMDEDEWSIQLGFDEVKAMFDPIIERIIGLISSQLSKSKNCSALFLVGGFSESKYLQSRVREALGTSVRVISVPPYPSTAIVKGAVQYGLGEEVISTRVLKWTYGADITRNWKPGDPEDRKTDDGKIVVFSRLAKRGTQVAIDEKVLTTYHPCYKDQPKMGLDLYVTPQDDAKYCDEPHVKLLGQKWSVNLPKGKDRSILYTMRFGSIEIEVTAVDSTGVKSGYIYDFDL